MAFQCKGMGVALVTPFHPDETIDYESLARLIDFQIAAGADFLVALGTTAETPTLTPEERRSVQRFVLDHVAGRVPLVVGKGGNCTAAVIDELKHDDSLAGYDAILSVTPFYNKPSQEGIYRHFTAIADASPLPVILYNVPGRTGINMAPDTVGRLAVHPRITAIKEASGSVSQTAEIVRCVPPGFNVLSGDDGITLPLMSLGATGVISVLGNAYPEQFTRLVHAALDGNTDTATELHHTFGPLYRLLFTDGNPSGVKCLLSLLGLCGPTLRLPLTPVTAATEAKMRQFVESI